MTRYTGLQDFVCKSISTDDPELLSNTGQNLFSTTMPCLLMNIPDDQFCDVRISRNDDWVLQICAERSLSDTTSNP